MHFRSDEKLRNVKTWDRTESWTPTRFPCRCQLYCCSCCNLHGLSSSPCLFSTCKSSQLKTIPLHTQGLCRALESRIGIFPSAACTGHPAYQFCVHTGDNEKNFRKTISGNENLPLESYLAKEFWTRFCLWGVELIISKIIKMFIELIFLHTIKTHWGAFAPRSWYSGQPQAAYQGLQAHWRLYFLRMSQVDCGGPGSSRG